MKNFLKTNLVLVIILLVSVALRTAAVFYLGDQVIDLPGTNDQVSYHNLALRVLGGHGFTFGEAWWPATPAGEPTAHWSYLYTYFLTFVYALFGQHPLAPRLLQALVVGILQPWLAYLLGKRLFSREVGLIAAALTAVYAYFIYYTATLMTEPFYIVAILASLYLAILYTQNDGAAFSGSKRALFLGFLLGIALSVAVLLRQLFLLFIPFIIIWMWWARRKHTGHASLWPIGVAMAVLLIAILPITLYNYSRFDRFVLLNTNAGFAFFWGNHPIYGTHFVSILPPEMGTYFSLIPKELLSLDEASLDQELLRRGLGFIKDDPVRYILLSISRIPAYFMFWPSSESGMVSNLSRVGSFGWLWPFMLYGFVLSLVKRPWSLIRMMSSPVFLLQMFVLIYTGIHLLTWALIRYRLPVDAVLLVFAALAFSDLYARIFSKRKFQTTRRARQPSG